LYLCGDLQNLNLINWDNKISSIKLGENTKIALYEDSNYEGHFYLSSKDISCLNDNFNGFSF